jgi:hypothetical protein
LSSDSHHIELLRRGPRAWNAWRAHNLGITPRLTGITLSAAERQMGPINGGPINLAQARLRHASLRFATLSGADLSGADLSDTDLSETRLNGANLAGADLTDALLGQREWQRDVAVSYNKIGDILRAGARRADEGNLEWQRDLSVAHTRIGSVLLRQGTRDEALVEYRAGLLIDEKLASAQPDDPQAQIDLAVSLFSLADSGDQPRANLARCLEIMRQLKGQGKLSGSQAGWIPTIEQRLAALPAGE